MGDLNDAQASLGPRIPRYKVPDDGKPHYVRILPGVYGKTRKFWAVSQIQHWIPRVGKKDMPVLCLANQVVRGKPHGKECGGCMILAKVQEYAQNDPQNKDIKKTVSKLSQQQSYDVQLLDRGEETPIIRRYSTAKDVMKWMVEAFKEAYQDQGSRQDIFDPMSGFDMWIRKTIAENQTDYTCGLRNRSTPIIADSADLEDFLAKIPNMEDAIVEQLARVATLDFDEYLRDVLASVQGKKTIARKPTPPVKPKKDRDNVPGLEETDEFDATFSDGSDDLPEAPDLDIE
jgi:hypothetical protein